MLRMWELIDSLSAAGHPRILSVGDFNDNVWPDADAPGTIKYNGAWEKIDGHFARGALSVEEAVFDHPLLSEPDRSFGGTKPRRSFSGPRWLGGGHQELRRQEVHLGPLSRHPAGKISENARAARAGGRLSV